MTTNHDELERMLGDELRDRAGVMTDAPLQLSDVRGRATSIRRRRRVAAGVGVAAALAIIVPAAITAAGSPFRTADPDPAPPVHEVERTTLTLDGLQRGDAPGVEYFSADGVVLPDGGLQPLEQSYQAMIPNDDGWLALSPSRDVLYQLDADFEVGSEALPVNQTLITDPERTRVAYATSDPDQPGELLVAADASQPDDGTSWSFPERSGVEPVDFAGDDRLLFQTTTPRGRSEVGVANPDGTTTMLDGYVHGISASPATGLAAVQTQENRDSSGCFGVVDLDGDPSEPMWETCDHSLGAFSPDGKYVLASMPYLSGFGVTTVAVLDAETGALVASFDQPRRGELALIGVTWESDDTFVAVAAEGRTSTILRFGVDGTLETTTEPVDGEPYADLAYYIGADRVRGF